MRPGTIVWFERLYVLFLTASVLERFRGFREMMAAFGLITTLVNLTIFLIIPLALALMVSRRRSRISSLFLILVTWCEGLAFISDFDLRWPDSPVDLALILLTATPMAVTLLLFTPSARAWLNAAAPISPEALRRTFD
jgi:hypothetical protein